MWGYFNVIGIRYPLFSYVDRSRPTENRPSTIQKLREISEEIGPVRQMLLDGVKDIDEAQQKLQGTYEEIDEAQQKLRDTLASNEAAHQEHQAMRQQQAGEFSIPLRGLGSRSADTNQGILSRAMSSTGVALSARLHRRRRSGTSSSSDLPLHRRQEIDVDELEGQFSAFSRFGGQYSAPR
ncbi:hypothetical protein CNYM01_01615 [Colletotrichum nymphaeae SA-01]|uniref:Uncharacterized protein n=1 Tax=Colletotrichum nymphaeae SA-01 TaxID=1460502 RepID=A0A135UIV5_9PEZI|nr:hypothetical protein CNYM01_01615 [Colletotrichum nymphaeae SA-01]